jgi:hypothetical protein
MIARARNEEERKQDPRERSLADGTSHRWSQSTQSGNEKHWLSRALTAKPGAIAGSRPGVY